MSAENLSGALMAVDEHGNKIDRSILEDADIAFAPESQHLDLTKDEKRRTTALMMAIQAYNNLIIKDADYYIAVSRDQGRDSAPRIRPATIEAMVEAAIRFDWFISGGRSTFADAVVDSQNATEEETTPSEEVGA